MYVASAFNRMKSVSQEQVQGEQAAKVAAQVRCGCRLDHLTTPAAQAALLDANGYTANGTNGEFDDIDSLEIFLTGCSEVTWCAQPLAPLRPAPVTSSDLGLALQMLDFCVFPKLHTLRLVQQVHHCRSMAMGVKHLRAWGVMLAHAQRGCQNATMGRVPPPFAGHL